MRQSRAVYNKRYRESRKGKATQKRYQQTEKGKIARRKAVQRNRQTEEGKTAHRKSNAKYGAKYPERKKAGHAVSIAIRANKLIHPQYLICHYCPSQAEEYHHKSYEPEHWLDVEAVCVECHTNMRKAS